MTNKKSIEDVSKEIQKTKDRWLIWIGFITYEDDDKREIEYYGKFAKTKKGAIGAARLLIDNTTPYRIIIQDIEPFKQDPKEYQTELEDFFQMEVIQ